MYTMWLILGFFAVVALSASLVNGYIPVCGARTLLNGALLGAAWTVLVLAIVEWFQARRSPSKDEGLSGLPTEWHRVPIEWHDTTHEKDCPVCGADNIYGVVHRRLAVTEICEVSKKVPFYWQMDVESATGEAAPPDAPKAEV